MDEKEVNSQSSPAGNSGDAEVVVDWDAEEERTLILKLDVYIMPLLLLAFFLLCLDRSNISNALTNHFASDLNISTSDASLGNQLQQAGIVISELPASFILTYVGPQRWLVFLMFSWGSVATFQCFIQNRAQYFATRFLLGMFEGGFVPGSMYLLGEFYTRSEVSTRFAVFYYGNYFASGTSSLIAAGLLTLDGVRSWSGWRWLFLVDGAMTMAFSIILFILLPGTPQDPRPIHKLFNAFNPRENHILHSRVQLTAQGQGYKQARVSFLEWIKTLITPYVWMHFVINFIGVMPAGGFVLFGPTIVKALGFNTLKANALISVGYYCALPLAVALAHFANWSRLNGVACLLPFTWECLVVGLVYHFDTIRDSISPWVLYALFMLVLSAMLIVQPVNNAWCNKNARSPSERSVGLALCVIGSNLGGLVGQELFKSSPAPEYFSGFIGALCLYVAAVGIVLAQIGQYWWANKRLGRRERQSVGNGGFSGGAWRFVL